jgi:type III pantothenate kinase
VILQCDVGNSAIKWRLSESGQVVGRGVVSRNAGSILPVLARSPQAVWIASVAGPDIEERLAAAAEHAWGVSPWFARTTSAACGVTNSYDAPERMGVDRWLAMIAAWQRIGDALCVIDAGTALTIDFLDQGGVHRGGYIIPGLAMMEQALVRDTDRVRFDEAPGGQIAPGRCTATAVRNGVQLAQLGAVDLGLSRFGADAARIFTGGDGALAMRLLEYDGRFVEDLVLEGLDCLGKNSADSSLRA